ncbi:MAG: hypothetical protein AAF368_10155 [Planctomycetota bacterium]
MTNLSKLAMGGLFALVLGSACSTTQASVVDDALLSKLTARERAEISDAQQVRDRAEADWIAAKELRVQAQKDIEIARSGLKISRAQLEQSELLVERASSQSIPEMTSARVSADWHRARVRASQATYEHARAYEAWTRSSSKLAKRELELSEAALELEKVRAVSGLGRQEQELDLPKFERTLAEREASVESARRRVRQAREVADRALADKNAAMEQASALTP